MTFRHERIGELRIWSGDPTCDDAYGSLAEHLATCPIPRLPSKAAFGLAHVGNLGEALAFLVGRSVLYPFPDYRMLGDNCGNPLAGHSKTGVDLLWLYFHPTDLTRDHAWVQEVKTTLSTTSAGYIRELEQDYAKLFGSSLGLSLDGRLGDAAWRLEQLACEHELAKRARALGARSPAKATRVTISPTAVHDLSLDALATMEDVRIALVQDGGWNSDQVEPHLIALSNLDARLTAMVR